MLTDLYGLFYVVLNVLNLLFLLSENKEKVVLKRSFVGISQTWGIRTDHDGKLELLMHLSRTEVYF